VTEMLAALPRTSHYVITSQQFNTPPDKHCVSHKFRQAVLKAGLDSRLHVHSLRHSFCTNLLAAGAPMLQDVQLIAGHSTIVVTQGYNQMRSGTLHKTVSILDGSLALGPGELKGPHSDEALKSV
jgi:site-specific recombinase XerD